MSSASALLFLLSTPLVLLASCTSSALRARLAEADRVFQIEEDMERAEVLYRDIAAAPGVDRETRARALRYANACVGRRGENQRAVREIDAWFAEFPEHEKRHYVRFFRGVYLRRLGRERQARATWDRVLDEAPQSKIADRIRGYAKTPRTTRKRKGPRFTPYVPGRVLRRCPPRPATRTLVIGISLDDPGFEAVARRAQHFHAAEYAHWDGRDTEALLELTRRVKPENVLFVVEPSTLDVNVHRRVVMSAARIDDDIFPDFAFGYLTARSAEELERLWSRIESMHRDGLPSKRWHTASVASTIRSTRYESAISDHAKAAGFEGDAHYFGSVESEAQTRALAIQTLHGFEKLAVLCMSGCGDPQGTWLFSDTRNRRRDLHWNYTRELVGHDPQGRMPRILADDFRGMALERSVVWSGVCHAGALERVYVESDIVSTFGRVERATLHLQKAEDSVVLALIDAGAGAFLGSIAANHGWACAHEKQFALREGASLGDAMKSTYDDVFLAARGRLELGIQVDGARHAEPENVMQGGGANRLLYGDPTLRVFKATPDPAERVVVRRVGARELEVVVEWPQKSMHPRAWDIFGLDRSRDWRVAARVDVSALLPDAELAITARVRVTDDAGRALPYELTHAEPECHAGKRILHLQANAARQEVQDKAIRATFQVRYQ